MIGSLAAFFAPVIKEALLAAHPVGSVYITFEATDPGQLFGGTWRQTSAGRMLVGVREADSDFARPYQSGGEKSHRLTEEELAYHRHIFAWEKSEQGQMVFGEYAPVAGGLTANGVRRYTVVTEPTGGNALHNNMPPYLVCYIWERIA